MATLVGLGRIDMTDRAYAAVHLVSAILLAIAVLDLPYGFYTILRIVICAIAAWLAVDDYRRASTITPWVITLAIIAALFNPIIPIYLKKDIWLFVDLAAGALIGLHWIVTQKTHR